MPYEEGMQLIFDMVERTITVSFRGTLKILGPFESQRQAVSPCEQYCRDRGWLDSALDGLSASHG
jgi:hypothetical protein